MASAPSKRKPKLEPISLKELQEDSTMTGFTSVFEIPMTAPALEHLAQDVLDTPPIVNTSPIVETGELNTGAVFHTPVFNTGRSETSQNAKRFRPLARARVSAMRTAHQGHTQAEQLLYLALWNSAPGEGPYKDVSPGNRRLMEETGLSERSVQLNLQTLECKLAIEVVARHNPDAQQPKTFRVYSAAEVLARRKAAGLLWVQTKQGGGVRLVTKPSD